MSRILFKKEGRAKFISHLDLMRTMQRVFIRAGLEIWHTEGFNPHPYMNFALPLSVGTESLCELMDFKLLGDMNMDQVPDRLNRTMPEGITVLEAYEETRKFKEIKWLDIEGRLVYDKGGADVASGALQTLFAGPDLVIEKKTKRGAAEVDIIPMIHHIDLAPASAGELRLTARIAAQEPTLSPSQLMAAIEQKRPDYLPDFVSFKRIRLLDKDQKPFR